MSRWFRDLVSYYTTRTFSRDFTEIEYHGGKLWSRDPNFGFRPELTPVPFIGDLKKARVFLLMLNPGWAPEYDREEAAYAHRQAANLAHDGRQSFWAVERCGTSFEKYWRRLLRPVRDVIGSWDPIIKNFAMLNLVPWRSAHFKYEKMFGSYPCELMKEFARNDLSKRSNTLVIVARRPGIWGPCTHECDDAIRFAGVQCRGIQLHRYADRIARKLG